MRGPYTTWTQEEKHEVPEVYLRRFRGHTASEVIEHLHARNFLTLTYTGSLQPMDLTVFRGFKARIAEQFRAWYEAEVASVLRKADRKRRKAERKYGARLAEARRAGLPEPQFEPPRVCTNVDTRAKRMRNLHLQWVLIASVPRVF
eukprot:TRINITY_DN3501_c0_g1_i3.p2 TRINITY_DN3501_c0_g1~~TRINITY_DN3501_c0_g1_i3.p2  ORF type:complete len:146 (+),score=3.11 TRINITY_DN3501_c0_g1_i3:315-752(+)